MTEVKITPTEISLTETNNGNHFDSYTSSPNNTEPSHGNDVITTTLPYIIPPETKERYVTNDKVVIKIKYLNESVPRIKKVNVGDWIDLYAAERVILHKGDRALINLGIAIELPRGFEAILAPRSSTFKHWGIIQTNSIGIIDETYCGDEDYWKLPVYCLRATDNAVALREDDNFIFKFIWKHTKINMLNILKKYFPKTFENHRITTIEPGDKIAQFRIIWHMPEVALKEVESLDNESRGGFGSTGKK